MQLPSGQDRAAVLERLKSSKSIPTDSVFRQRVFDEDIPIPNDDWRPIAKAMAKAPITMVDPRILIASQEKLNSNAVLKLLAGAKGSPSDAQVVVIDGRAYALDGHHRAAAALLKGESLSARVVDISGDRVVPRTTAGEESSATLSPMNQSERPTSVLPESGTHAKGGSDAYLGRVRSTLLKLGAEDPDGDLVKTGDFWKHCESAGVSAETAAATIYATARHKHAGGTTLREAAEEARPDRRERETSSDRYNETLAEKTSGLVPMSETELVSHGIFPVGGEVVATQGDRRFVAFRSFGYGETLNHGRANSTMRFWVRPNVASNAAEAPTNTEWQVDVRRSPRYTLQNIVAIAGQNPTEITDRSVIFGGFHDDEKAQALARRMTASGLMTTFGPKPVPSKLELEKLAAEDRKTAYRWAEVYFADLSDAERFARAVEKQASNIGAFTGGTKHGATVTTNASASIIDKVLAKNRWKGSYSLSSSVKAAEPTAVAVAIVEGDPSAMPVAAETAPSDGTPPSRIQWIKVTRDPQKFAAFMKQSEAIGVVNTPEKVFALIGPDLMKEEQEVFLVIPLNLRGELKCPPYEIARGQRSRVTVGVNNVIEAAMDAHCEGILICHNHPTGRCTPSAADRKLTEEIKRACAPYGKDLTYIDHVIIGVNQYYSIGADKLYKVK